MSFKVPATIIKEVRPLETAHSLEVVKIYDFDVVTGKGRYKPGDIVLYVPIDSLLPKWLEERLFGPDSKIKLNKGRVKQIRIRGKYSQGMAIDPDLIQDKIPVLLQEEDYASALEITKYEPGPAPFEGSPTGKTSRNKPKENPFFHKYNGVENLKWYPDLFKSDEEVVIQEKLHGSNCRAAILPFQANTLLKRVQKFFGFAPKYEYCYGSNNVQLQERKNFKGYYGDNVYGKVLNKVKAFDKIKPGETIYGELIGEGIQKNYTYGHKEHHFVLFDVKVIQENGEQRWLNPEEVNFYALSRGFDVVPILYKGLFDKDIAYKLTQTDSVYYPEQKIIEGIVIKSRYNYNDPNMPSNKKCLKLISEKYLEKDQSDFH